MVASNEAHGLTWSLSARRRSAEPKFPWAFGRTIALKRGDARDFGQTVSCGAGETVLATPSCRECRRQCVGFLGMVWPLWSEPGPLAPGPATVAITVISPAWAKRKVIGNVSPRFNLRVSPMSMM